MLVITVKDDQGIICKLPNGERMLIKVKFRSGRSKKAKLLIEAPCNVNILREELCLVSNN